MINIIKKIYSFIHFSFLRYYKGLSIYKTILFLSKIKGLSYNKIIMQNATLNRTHIYINGRDNVLQLNGAMLKSDIFIDGNKNYIEFSSGTVLNFSNLIVRGDNCYIKIGQDTTFGGAYVVCMGHGNSIEIGSRCMFAENIDIWNTDSHPIYSLNDNALLNPSMPIRIGSHVWVGKGAKILKGVIIGDNAIIGMNSLVTKMIPANTLNVGSPTRIIRKDINWERKFIMS